MSFNLCRFPECHFGKAGNLQTIEPGRSWPNWSAATNGFQSPLRKWYMFVCRECQTEYLYHPDRRFLSGVKHAPDVGKEDPSAPRFRFSWAPMESRRCAQHDRGIGHGRWMLYRAPLFPCGLPRCATRVSRSHYVMVGRGFSVNPWSRKFIFMSIFLKSSTDEIELIIAAILITNPYHCRVAALP